MEPGQAKAVVMPQVRRAAANWKFPLTVVVARVRGGSGVIRESRRVAWWPGVHQLHDQKIHRISPPRPITTTTTTHKIRKPTTSDGDADNEPTTPDTSGTKQSTDSPEKGVSFAPEAVTLAKLKPAASARAKRWSMVLGPKGMTRQKKGYDEILFRYST